MKRIALVIVVCLAGLVPSTSNADHQGCYVYGEVLGLDIIRECSYIATSEAQSVHVATPNAWRVWVERTAPNGQPVDVTLAEGHGPVAGPPPVVTPEVGEEVFVWMFAGCDLPLLCGTIGALEVGMSDGH